MPKDISTFTLLIFTLQVNAQTFRLNAQQSIGNFEFVDDGWCRPGPQGRRVGMACEWYGL